MKTDITAAGIAKKAAVVAFRTYVDGEGSDLWQKVANAVLATLPISLDDLAALARGEAISELHEEIAERGKSFELVNSQRLVAMDRAEAFEARATAAEAELVGLRARDDSGMDGAAIHAVREVLYAGEVPTAAFIDDHVANAIVQRNQERARATALLEALQLISGWAPSINRPPALAGQICGSCDGQFPNDNCPHATNAAHANEPSPCHPRAAEAASPAAGWRLVPVKPTMDMIDAGLGGADDWRSLPPLARKHEHLERYIYEAMLKAAPSPSEESPASPPTKSGVELSAEGRSKSPHRADG